MLKLCSIINGINSSLGRLAMWLCLILVILQVVVVLNRYCFGYAGLLGHAMINYEEALLYIFAGCFMFGSALTYIQDGHVRVDIFYAGSSQRRKDIVDIFGNLLLLLPFVLLLLIKSNKNLDLAWSIAEGSTDGGLPFVYLLQSILPIFAISMATQAISNAISLTLKNARNPNLAAKIWAIAIGLIAAYLCFITFSWANWPDDWKQPDPQWRFYAYSTGVWLARLLSVGLVGWCAYSLSMPAPQEKHREV